MIVADGLKKTYGKRVYLDGICAQVAPGRALAVVGENGAGKTTLLKILATASRPDEGTLMISGIDAIGNPGGARELIGYVPQANALMGELSVRDNLRYWMKTRDEIAYRQVIDLIGLSDVEKKKVKTLSGGMQKRLNIGASLVFAPKLLILDEPLAGVDILNRAKIVSSLNRMKKEGITIVFTSHYIEEMHALADELIALKDGKSTYYGDIDFSGSEFDTLSDAIRYYTA